MHTLISRRSRTVPAAVLALATLAVVLPGCVLGPDYRPPNAPMASAYTGASLGTSEAHVPVPADSHWWTVFHDVQLDSLELQADAANRDIKVAVAHVDEAMALIGSARSYLFPTVSAQPQASRNREAQDRPNNGNTGGRAATYNDLQLPLVLNYEIDAWGRVRRTLEAARASEQASEADLRFVRLVTEAAVAVDYFQLRETDQEIGVIDGTVRDLQQALDLVELRFRHGLNSDLEVAEAKTLLDQTNASEQALETQRDQLQHGMAVLLGRTPEGFVVAKQAGNPRPPAIPVGLPSELLQRRPDIVAADRSVAAATARIGVAKAAYFPRLSLTGIGGYESTDPVALFSWQNTMATVGASAVAPIFTGGRIRAGVEQAQAAYRESLAQYEKTVLQSYRQVEDQLSELHNLSTQARLQDLAIQDASRAEQVATERFKRGLVSYLDVVQAQQNVLFNERTAAQIAGQRLTASVVLIKALGGGWDDVAPRSPAASALLSGRPILAR
jgi:multidrug efflux system outer membrane protein